jgi:hypothetical protein
VYSAEYELETLPAYEDEYEGEWEYEDEDEQFWGELVQQFRTPGSPLRRVALGAARSALSSGGSLLGARLGGKPGQVLGSSLGGAVGGLLPARESEEEWEWELQSGMAPLTATQADALMEHLGGAAAEAESEAEAEAFIGALIPLAARVLPAAAKTVMRVAPRLIKGASQVVRTLRRNPATRRLVRTVPTIVRRTAASLARQASTGRPITGTRAARTLAGQAYRVLSHPQRCARAVRRSAGVHRRALRAA